jgi:hypothetical protein
LFHGLALTVASIIIYADPSVAGLTEFVPLPVRLFYVVTNVLLILYTIVLYVLMLSRKQSAIAHNVIFNILSVVFLVAWHFLDMKSMHGTVVDAVPNIVCSVYIPRFQRVRWTFRRGPVGAGMHCRWPSDALPASPWASSPWPSSTWPSSLADSSPPVLD